jgi:hypothetical protein
MHIPFKSYRGPATKLMMLPDIENLSKLAVQNKGKQELRKAIFKALDLEEINESPSSQPPPGAQPAPSTDASSSENSSDDLRPEEVLIESVLEAIFK